MSNRTSLVVAGLATLMLAAGSGCGGFMVESRAGVANSLPYRACPAPIRANGARVRLPSGVYRCNIVVIGNGNRVVGSTFRRTIIEGNLIVRGNGNVVKRMRVLGATRVAGFANRVNYRKYHGVRVVQPRRTHWVYR